MNDYLTSMVNDFVPTTEEDLTQEELQVGH